MLNFWFIISIMKKLFIIHLLFVIAVSTYSLDFNISPNKDGTMDVDLGLDWNYSDGFFSGIMGKYQNIHNNSETSEQYVATSGTVLSLDMDFIGYRIKKERIRFDIALNAQLQDMDIREIGYIDSEGTRYFILNDRNLRLLLPRVKGKFSYKYNSINFSVGGEYSPWLKVDLDQELTISPGLEEIPFSSSQSANNGFSLNSTIRFSSLFITPEISIEYDHLAIVYDVYTAGGEATIDTLLQTFTTNFTLVLNIINLKGLNPTISYGYVWDWATDMSIDSSPDLSKDSSFSFGFEF